VQVFNLKGEFIREFGKEQFDRQVTQAMPLSAFLLNELSQRCDLNSSEGKAQLIYEAKPLLLKLPTPLLRLQPLYQKIHRRRRHAIVIREPMPAAGRFQIVLLRDAERRHLHPQPVRAFVPAQIRRVATVPHIARPVQRVDVQRRRAISVRYTGDNTRFKVVAGSPMKDHHSSLVEGELLNDACPLAWP
jgi:DNA primase